MFSAIVSMTDRWFQVPLYISRCYISDSDNSVSAANFLPDVDGETWVGLSALQLVNHELNS